MIKNRLQQLWRWLDERSGFSDLAAPMMNHVVPRDAGWWYVFGSATLCAFMVQILTGVCLAMSYVPGGGEAYASLKYITNEALLGNFMRGMHYYGASAMIALAAIHLTQVYLHASYKYPRELNWMSGVVIFFVVLGMAFTGQLLRWDANGVWSVTVAAEMAGRTPLIGPSLARFVLGGETVGGATLSRFFVLHVFVLPGLIFAAVAIHLRLVLRHGISEMPKVGEPVDPATYKQDYEARLKRTGVPFWPNAAWRDAVFATGVVAVIVGCAIIFGAPALGNPPDPSSIEANPMPDWYFWWYFAILSMLPPGLETWVILGAPAIGFLVLFFLPLISNRGERALSKRPWAIAVVFSLAVGFVVLTIYGANKPWSPDFGVEPLPADVVGAAEGPIAEGARLLHTKGCLYCHNIDGHGGHRGPELSHIGNQLTVDELIIRINNGGHNMPAFAGSLTAEELKLLVGFLQTRRGELPGNRAERSVSSIAGSE